MVALHTLKIQSVSNPRSDKYVFLRFFLPHKYSSLIIKQSPQTRVYPPGVDHVQ